MGKKTESTKPAATSARAAKPAAKKAAKPAAVAKKTEPTASVSAPPAAKKPAKNTLKKTAASKVAYSADDIALRAYFIAEKRHQKGLPGNPHQDWLEAEHQLRAESGGKSSAKSKAKA